MAIDKEMYEEFLAFQESKKSRKKKKCDDECEGKKYREDLEESAMAYVEFKAFQDFMDMKEIVESYEDGEDVDEIIESLQDLVDDDVLSFDEAADMRDDILLERGGGARMKYLNMLADKQDDIEKAIEKKQRMRDMTSNNSRANQYDDEIKALKDKHRELYNKGSRYSGDLTNSGSIRKEIDTIRSTKYNGLIQDSRRGKRDFSDKFNDDSKDLLANKKPGINSRSRRLAK